MEGMNEWEGMAESWAEALHEGSSSALHLADVLLMSTTHRRGAEVEMGTIRHAAWM